MSNITTRRAKKWNKNKYMSLMKVEREKKKRQLFANLIKPGSLFKLRQDSDQKIILQAKQNGPMGKKYKEYVFSKGILGPELGPTRQLQSNQRVYDVVHIATHPATKMIDHINMRGFKKPIEFEFFYKNFMYVPKQKKRKLL